VWCGNFDIVLVGGGVVGGGVVDGGGWWEWWVVGCAATSTSFWTASHAFLGPLHPRRVIHFLFNNHVVPCIIEF